MKARIVALTMGLVGILIGALLVSGVSPGETLTTLIHGSLGTASALSGSLRETTPLLIAGIAVYIALRAGLFNIGVEGQLVVGAAATSWLALRFPGWGGVLLGVLAGMLAGGLWALPAGLIRAYRNGHEVITTIMLNNIALLLTDWLVAGPLRAPSQESPTTAAVPTRVPDLIASGPLTISVALVAGVLLCLGVHWWMRRTVSGYELQASGAEPQAARYAGISPKQVMVRAMFASGCVSGFAGAMQVLAYEGRFYSGFSPGYGFDALGVALLAGSNGLALLPASLLFGILAKGGTALQIDGVPKGITTVVLGLLILLASAIRYRRLTPVE